MLLWLVSKTLIFGEIGLSGELRAVSFCEKRVVEALKLGFETVVIPKDNLKEVSSIKGIKIYPVSNINELLKIVIS